MKNLETFDQFVNESRESNKLAKELEKSIIKRNIEDKENEELRNIRSIRKRIKRIK
jgi:hypothetical protein